MRTTLATFLLGTTLLTASWSKHDKEMRRSGSSFAMAERVERGTADKASESNAGSAAVYAGDTAASPPPYPAQAIATTGTATKEANASGDTHTDHGSNPWTDAAKDHLSMFAADVRCGILS